MQHEPQLLDWYCGPERRVWIDSLLQPGRSGLTGGACTTQTSLINTFLEERLFLFFCSSVLFGSFSRSAVGRSCLASPVFPVCARAVPVVFVLCVCVCVCVTGAGRCAPGAGRPGAGPVFCRLCVPLCWRWPCGVMMSPSYHSPSKRQKLECRATNTLLIASKLSHTVGVSVGYATGRGCEKCNPIGLGSQAYCRICNECCAHV